MTKATPTNQKIGTISTILVHRLQKQRHLHYIDTDEPANKIKLKKRTNYGSTSTAKEIQKRNSIEIQRIHTDDEQQRVYTDDEQQRATQESHATARVELESIKICNDTTRYTQACIDKSNIESSGTNQLTDLQ